MTIAYMNDNYLNWGCEYLDLEYRVPPEKRKTLPISIVEKLVDQNRKAEILNNEKSYINALMTDIRQNGLKKPLEITIAPNGATLIEGNHRFICLELLKKEEIPVVIKLQEQNIKQGGIRTYEFIKFLLRENYNI